MRKQLVRLLLILLLPYGARGNVVGADTQNFNPISSGLDFVTVHSSETLRPCYFNCGVFLNYAVNSLPNFEGTSGNRTNFSDTLLSSDISFGMGLGVNWDMGVSFAQVHSQSVKSDIVAGEYEQTGLTDVRFNTKYRLSGDEKFGMAVVATVNFNQIEDNPYLGENPGPILNLEFVADTTLGHFALAGNLGYRFRDPGKDDGTNFIEPIDDQVIASVGLNYLLPQYDTKLIAEIFSSFPTKDQDNATNRDLSSAELLVGAKWDIRHDMAFHFGGGTELVQGTASPDWRVYSGINISLGPAGYCKEGQTKIVAHRELQPKYQSMVEGDEFKFSGSAGPKETFLAKDILFEFDSDLLTEDFRLALAKLVAYLRQPPAYKKLTIAGHTDSIGDAAYNLDLSERRAKAVRAFLVKEFGLDGAKVISQGLGERHPIADNGNFQGRALNRRVEFIIER